MSFDPINLLITATVVANSAYGLLVYTTKRSNATNRAFFALTIAVSLWGVGMVAYRGLPDMKDAAFSARLLYAAAALIPYYFVRFASVFPDSHFDWKRWQRILLAAPTLAAIIFALVPGALVVGVMPAQEGERIIEFMFGTQVLYAAYMTFYFTWVLALLTKKALAAHGEGRTQLLYILLATSVPTLVGSLTNLYLPFFGYYELNWVGQISIVVTTTIITYGMFKHRVFDARVIGTEVLMFILWTLSFSNIVFATDTRGVFSSTIVFALTVAFGALLVRSMIREVKSREEIERLAENLAEANESLRELDRQKSEFLSIASHQLRTPLAAIKGYASLMLDGTYGLLSAHMKAPVETIFASSSRMADTVGDFLNVSKIEQGRMEYRLKREDLSKLVKEVVGELSIAAKDRKLDLSYHDDGTGPYIIDMDASKLEHVIVNLVDNSIKYTPRGSITVRIDRDTNRRQVVLRVIDTGAGIPRDALPRLFDKFIRARNAKDINVTGTGLGLYVAREMVRAHKGTVSAASEGEGKGSTFTVTLPLAR